jgi:hypothetical protein
MEKILVYDNNGETADRYSVYIQTGKDKFEAYSMSGDPFHPQGVNMYGGEVTLKQVKDFAKYHKTDKKLAWNKVPAIIKEAIKRRME